MVARTHFLFHSAEMLLGVSSSSRLFGSSLALRRGVVTSPGEMWVSLWEKVKDSGVTKGAEPGCPEHPWRKPY